MSCVTGNAEACHCPEVVYELGTIHVDHQRRQQVNCDYLLYHTTDSSRLEML